MNDLIAPILLSSVASLVISVFTWRILPFHAREHRYLSSEHELLAALRQSSPSPGIYSFPYRGLFGANTERHDVAANLERGPVGFVVIGKSGAPRIVGPLVQHFLFFLVVTAFTAYIALMTGLKDGAPFDRVFHVVAIVSTMTLVIGSTPLSIWFSRPWKSWLLQVIDGLACGATTGALFGWLWPL
jgi:hypothetical protein